uniref:protein Mpv17 n=1 Tax=Erigeron canadensis TaxID=72917 RepID=UPI001CB95957|nr:protein Mpv17 [Erigeron canadensis]XP_043636698.1 protein Mpv17 [Erigeron canadensis]
MGTVGGGGFGMWRIPHSNFDENGKRIRKNIPNSSSGSSPSSVVVGGWFPLKQAVTAASLALTGDTIAQLRDRYQHHSDSNNNDDDPHQDARWSLMDHNWLRALRMASYGFLLYGPGSYVWYQYLDRWMPQQTAQNVLIKVVLNQIVLGPSVIAVVFAWNNLWQGKLAELPNKYQKDALRTLLFGFRFWIPVSVINFWAIPLQARVAFMSLNSIFWNFYLSSTMSK